MNQQADTAVVIVAAGQGVRAGGGVPKQWRVLRGQMVLDHTIAAFAGHPRIAQIVVVLDDTEAPRARALQTRHDVGLARGGSERVLSVRAGLDEVRMPRVLIHDAARPCVPDRVIDDVLGALDQSPAAAPALAVTDALWRGSAGKVTGTVDREGLYRAQTPQGFHTHAIRNAHADHQGAAADDVAVALAAGLEVAIVAGCENNIKITTPDDFDRAGAILEARHGR